MRVISQSPDVSLWCSVLGPARIFNPNLFTTAADAQACPTPTCCHGRAGGTRVYEERRRESLKLMRDCETKRVTIQSLVCWACLLRGVAWVSPACCAALAQVLEVGHGLAVEPVWPKAWSGGIPPPSLEPPAARIRGMR